MSSPIPKVPFEPEEWKVDPELPPLGVFLDEVGIYVTLEEFLKLTPEDIERLKKESKNE